MDLRIVCQSVCQMIREKWPEATVWVKEDGSLCSSIDQGIEDILRQAILKHHPTHLVLGEEGGYSEVHEDQRFLNQSTPVWILDPIDGTEVYYGGLPTYSVSIACYHQFKCLWAVLMAPATNTILEWSPEDGLWLNERPFFPSLSRKEAPLFFLPSNYHEKYKVYWPGKMRSLGSICFHAMQTIRGLANGFLFHKAKIWDIAAVLPILHSVGILAVDMQGMEIGDNFFSPAYTQEKPILCTWPETRREMLEAIRLIK
jgi:myo-inositol-1(or 4)-monophosphatase